MDLYKIIINHKNENDIINHKYKNNRKSLYFIKKI